MTVDIVSKINAITRHAGKPATWDHTKIDGFSADDPPPTTSPRERPAPDRFEDIENEVAAPLDPEVIAHQSEPARVFKAVPKPEPKPEPAARLVILDRHASYLGNEVSLSETEEAQMARIVVRALTRQLKAIQDALPRVRKPRATKATEAPKKRGRPRKVPVNG